MRLGLAVSCVLALGVLATAQPPAPAPAPPAKPTPAEKTSHDPAPIPAEAPPLEKTLAGSSSYHKWVLNYQVPPDRGEFHINDFRFPSARRGIAVGYLETRKNAKPYALVTSDGGQNWKLVETDRIGISIFFLNDSVGWMVTDKSLYQTREGGLAWTRVKKAPKDLLRVYFLDEKRGFAIGFKKAAYRTVDGGDNWEKIAAADEQKGNPKYSAYSVIAFLQEKYGLIYGISRPPRPMSQMEERLPGWSMPESAVERREIPHLSLTLETMDGGNTWKPAISSIFGEVTQLVLDAERGGFALFNFEDAFDWPSEVYHLMLRGGESASIFRRPDRLITDVAAVPEGPVIIAGVEPHGRLAAQSPIPGQVKVLSSNDLKQWVEQDVDYRADALRVFLGAPDASNVWLATDTGMILKLTTVPRAKNN